VNGGAEKSEAQVTKNLENVKLEDKAEATTSA
jgi:hypothetical protein